MAQTKTILGEKCRRKKFHLKVSGHAKDEDWISIVITPTKAGIHAYDYVEILSEVEKELRARGFEQVLLVPALAD